MLESWKHCVASGCVGRFRAVFTFRFRFMFSAGLMAAARDKEHFPFQYQRDVQGRQAQ